jgi:NAD(P)-dependent dehydrogenase (short-subunit alcohol dehydrogenase family)
MELAGRTALVTGASGGLGQAIARRLSAEGMTLLLTGRRQGELATLADEVGGTVVVADLADRADLDRLCGQLEDVDVLVANAGLGDPDDQPYTPELVDHVLDVNLRAPMLLSTAFAGARAGRSGHIVLVGSLQGLVALPEYRLYSATKFGLRGFALSLRPDLAKVGIGVTHLAPGFIRDAGMFADSGIDLPAGVRTRSPEEVGELTAKAIRDDVGEVFVSPPELRFASTLGGLTPGLTAKVMGKLMPERG